MLSVTGMNRFYYLRGFTDMRCKHSRVLSVIREQLHREPSDGDIYIVMSKDRRIVRLFAYDHRSYSLFETLTLYYFRETLYLSLIILTQPAPIIRNTPANISMFTSGATLPGLVNIFSTIPPKEAATICGTQIVPLNNPR